MIRVQANNGVDSGWGVGVGSNQLHQGTTEACDDDSLDTSAPLEIEHHVKCHRLSSYFPTTGFICSLGFFLGIFQLSVYMKNEN